jgi:hypothetical protein
MGAQNWMKQIYDKTHTDMEFSTGDWVYFRLQEYRQHSMHRRLNKKLSHKFFGPYRVLEKIGPMAYILALPPKAKIHNVFHVSVLKKLLVIGCPVQDTLSTIVEDVELTPPEAILDHRTTQGHVEILVPWQGQSPTNTMWEIKAELLLQFPSLGLKDLKRTRVPAMKTFRSICFI